MLTKFFYSTMKGAPVITNEWGSLLTMLKGCLLTGFNQQQVTSVSILDGVATITLGSNHGFIEHQVVAIDGAAQVGFNTDHRVVTVTATTITVNTSVTGAITGTMTIKTAPMGWTEKFTGTNKSIFEPKNKIKNPFILRVDDSLPVGYDTTWAKFARVTIAEGANGIDDFSGFAKAPQLTASDNVNEVGDGVTGAAGIYGWAKWYHGIDTNLSARRREASALRQGSNFDWVLVGDDANFYLLLQFSEAVGRATYAFSAIDSVSSTDKYNAFLSATNWKSAANVSTSLSNSNGYYEVDQAWGSNVTTAGKYLLRDYGGVNKSNDVCAVFTLSPVNGYQVSGFSPSLPFPNGADNSVVVHSIYVRDLDGLRGKLPMINWILQKWTLGDKVVLDKSDGKYLIAGVERTSATIDSFYAFRLEG